MAMRRMTGVWVLLLASALSAHAATVAVFSSAGTNGSVAPSGTVPNVNSGDDVVFNATPDGGFDVDKWYVNGLDANNVGPVFTLKNVTTASNVLVTFKPSALAPFIYTVVAGANGMVNPSGSVQIAQGGSKVIAAIPDLGFDVDQWYVDGVATSPGQLTINLLNVQHNGSVVVTFKPSASAPFVYQVTAGPNGAVSPTGMVQIAQGASKLLTAIPDAGYNVDQWYVDGIAQSAGLLQITLSQLQHNGSVVVTFTQSVSPPFTYTIAAGANGTVSPNGPVQIAAGQTVTLSAIPSAGFAVDQWFVDGVAGFANQLTIPLMNLQHNGSVVVTFKALPNAGLAPSITSATSTVAMLGDPFSFTFQASGSPAATVTISAAQLADTGLTIANNILSGTPKKAGTFNLTVVASNSVSPDAIQDFTLFVDYPSDFNDPGPLDDAAFKLLLASHASMLAPNGIDYVVFTENAHRIIGIGFDADAAGASDFFTSVFAAQTTKPVFADVVKGTPLLAADADTLFTAELENKKKAAAAFVGKTQFDALPKPIKEVVVDNEFQGIYVKTYFTAAQLRTLKNGLKNQNFKDVYVALLQSNWATQFKNRSGDLLPLVAHVAGLDLVTPGN